MNEEYTEEYIKGLLSKIARLENDIKNLKEDITNLTSYGLEGRYTDVIKLIQDGVRDIDSILWKLRHI